MCTAVFATQRPTLPNGPQATEKGSRFAMQPLYVPAVALHNIVTSIPQAIGTRLARRVVTEMAVPKRGLLVKEVSFENMRRYI